MAQKTKTPSFGASKKALLEQKVAELVDHLEALDNLVETQSKVILSLREELTELRELHVAEMNLRVVYTMRQMSFRRKSSAIADASGVVPTVIETLMDRYRNGGRAALLAQLEAENEAIAKQQAEQPNPEPPAPARTGDIEPLEPTDEDIEQIKSGRTN